MRGGDERGHLLTCQMRGCVTLAKRPTTSPLTGTLRQPSTLRPSFLATASRIALLAVSSLSSLGMKIMPTL